MTKLVGGKILVSVCEYQIRICYFQTTRTTDGAKIQFFFSFTKVQSNQSDGRTGNSNYF